MIISMHIKRDIFSPTSFSKMEFSSYFLRCTKIMMISVGLWPFKLYNENWQIIYKAYSSIILAEFLIFVVTLLIGWKDLVHGSDLQLANYLQYLITYVFTAWKIFLVRSAPVKKLVVEILSLERAKMASNEDIEKIHHDVSRHNFKIFGSLLFVTTMAVIQFIIRTSENLLMWKKAESQGIETEKALIFPQWFPFGTKKVFDVIYVYQICNGTLGGGLIVATDTLFVSLILFTSLRLRALGYELKNFGREIEDECRQNTKILRKLILEHKDIIRYVADLNASLKYYFLVDFLAKSYHISIVMFNMLVVFKASKFEFTCYMTNSSILFVEVAMLYIQANDVSLESEQLGSDIYESNWYNQSPDIKKSLHIMMLRTQQPLKLASGGIIVLDNKLFLKILRAAYTYLLFSNQIRF